MSQSFAPRDRPLGWWLFFKYREYVNISRYESSFRFCERYPCGAAGSDLVERDRVIVQKDPRAIRDADCDPLSTARDDHFLIGDFLDPANEVERL